MKSNRNKHFETPDALRHDVHTLSTDAEALVEATTEAVDEKVKAARRQLAATIARSRHLLGDIQQGAVERARHVDEAIHDHPYQTAVVALGVGTLLGLLCFRRH